MSSDDEMVIAGWLDKEGHTFKTWKKRWFVLLKSGQLKYYADDSCATCKGTYQLTANSSVNVVDERGSKTNCFALSAAGDNGSDVLLLCTENDTIRVNWMRAFEETAEHLMAAVEF